MNRLFRGLALAAAVVSGGLLAAGPALASDPGQMRVEDDAGLFSREGISRAKEKFQGVTFKSPTHYMVVTKAKVPADKQGELDAAAKDNAKRNRFFADWARELARQGDRKGDVFTLVFRNEKGNYQVETVTDRQTDVFRNFGDRKAADVSNEFLKSLKRTKTEKLDGDAAKKEMDEALMAATMLVIDDLKSTAAPSEGERTRPANNAGAGHTRSAGGSGIMGYICIGLCVLLGVWLVIGLIRTFSGGGGGGGGYGGGYGGGGGGGGGFFSSLLGGMFGAAAGMYLYDSFMGGHHSSDLGSDAAAAGGYDSGATDVGDGDYAGGAEGGGGDFGGDGGDAGGDAGGGGDWGGGGGDAGGGGDWGGGGGDFGGGGGDFGGGGGDW